MTDQAIDDEDMDMEGEELSEGEGGSDKKRLSGKKIVLFIALPVLLVVGAAVAFSLGLTDTLFGNKKDAAEIAKEELAAKRAKAVFFDLPELLVNLNSQGRKTSFLKISISLEVTKEEDVVRLQALMPRVIDSFQVYLRELRVSDLKGSAGIYRLREDLLRRVNEAAQPVEISDVLFKEVLIQ